MFEIMADMVAHIASRRVSPRWRMLCLIIGAVMFLVVVPAVLITIARRLTNRFRAGRRDAMRFIAGIPAVLGGLGLVAWSALTFWTRGNGTPAPLAAPQRLVTEGPFRYCRNPIQLGAMLYYFGIGCLAESIGAGFILLGISGVLGTAYHRLVEEKELGLRFGKEYEEYRAKTPYLIPRFSDIHPHFSISKEQERKS